MYVWFNFFQRTAETNLDHLAHAGNACDNSHTISHKHKRACVTLVKAISFLPK